MKIYKLNDPHKTYINGDSVIIGKDEIDTFSEGLKLTYENSDAIPFEYLCETDTLVIGNKGGIHANIPTHPQQNIVDGRVWLNSKIMVSWFELEPNEIKSIINQFPYDIKDFYYWEYCERDDVDCRRK